MGIFDPTPGARWARVLEKLAERQALRAELDRTEQMRFDAGSMIQRMDLMQRRVAAEMAIIEELRWLHDLGVLEVVAEVLPTLAERARAINRWNSRADLQPTPAEAMRCPEVMALVRALENSVIQMEFLEDRGPKRGSTAAIIERARTALSALEQEVRHE